MWERRKWDGPFHQRWEPNRLQKAASLAEIVNHIARHELTWAQNGIFFFFLCGTHQCGEAACGNLLNAGVIARRVCVGPFIGETNVSSELAGLLMLQERRVPVPVIGSWRRGKKKIRNSSCLAGMQGTGILHSLLPRGGLVSFGSRRWLDWWLERLECLNLSDWTAFWTQPLPLPLVALS